jgi:hypothetical protein
MTLILTPDAKQPAKLRAAYDRAFKEATELYIASAYLTDWNPSKRLGNQCRHLSFFVGTNFGLSRKSAMLRVMGWLPKSGSFLFNAVLPGGLPGGFHPKIVFWKTAAGKHFCILGSANLSKAAFHDNYEANALMPITKADFEQLRTWLSRVQSVPITKDWIQHKYTEAPLAKLNKSGAPSQASAHFQFKFKPGINYGWLIQARRQRQVAFQKMKQYVRRQIADCAHGKISNKDFWKWFWTAWQSWRFQGKGLEMTCKSASWRQACQSLEAVLKASVITRDQVVSREIDKLSKSRNPARSAWFSEMLCHFFPGAQDGYPLKNAPVRHFLKQNHYRGTPGLTAGQRYAELGRQLRAAVAAKPKGARNLAELDTVIWAQFQNSQRKAARPAKQTRVPKTMP